MENHNMYDPFEMSGTTLSPTKHHIPEDLDLNEIPLLSSGSYIQPLPVCGLKSALWLK